MEEERVKPPIQTSRDEMSSNRVGESHETVAEEGVSVTVESGAIVGALSEIE